MAKSKKVRNPLTENGKRLKFKTHRKPRDVPPRSQSKATIQPNTSDHKETNTSRQDSSKQRRTARNQKDQYVEWGPMINGYQFVATDPNEKQTYFKPQSVDYLVNSYDWSYMEVPSYKSFQEYLHEKYPDNTKGGKPTNGQNESIHHEEEKEEEGPTSFDEYFKFWETSFKQRGMLLYPVSPGDRITKENVLKFIETSTLPLQRVLKIERIKWHPDKFAKLTKDDKDLEVQITEIFQIVNEIYEDLSK